MSMDWQEYRFHKEKLIEDAITRRRLRDLFKPRNANNQFIVEYMLKHVANPEYEGWRQRVWRRGLERICSIEDAITLAYVTISFTIVTIGELTIRLFIVIIV